MATLDAVRVLLATAAALLLLGRAGLARSGAVQLGTALNSGGLDDPPYLDAVRRYDARDARVGAEVRGAAAERGRYDFAFGDRLVDWASPNGKPMHGTTLIWCADAVLPGWLSRARGRATS